MKTRVLISVAILSAGVFAAGCQESTKPKGGYFNTRADRGQNIDSDSPAVPERAGVGLGAGTGNEPQGANAPVPDALRGTSPPAASPAADRAPGEVMRGSNPSTQPTSPNNTGGTIAPGR